jgi:hypothetical protein
MATLRENWIQLQLSQANESFRNTPATLYYNTPLQEMRSQVINTRESPTQVEKPSE